MWKEMMKIAIISDIHGNLLALNEVLNDIKDKNINQIYCLGDLVDFAPWSNEVISFFIKNKIPCLLGNHDERIALDLPLEHKEWLGNLPYQLELVFKTGNSFKKILLVHASLETNDQYVYETDDKQKMYSYLKDKNIDALVMGHTHQSYIQQVSNILFINSGSVGRSKEDDRKATYTILTLDEQKIEAEIIKVDYPIEEVASAIYSSDIPDFYGDFLLKK
jgi:putative phosphoesterase